MEGLEFGQVSGMSIFGMVFSGLIAFLLPVILAVVIRKKTKAWIPSLFIGAGIFIVVALILEGSFHKLILLLTGDAITGNIWLYAIYGGLAAGIFEETGRFLAMKLFMKKHIARENSLMYGVGHGGAEAIILMGITSVSNIAVSLMINSGTIFSTFSTLPEELRQTSFEQISPLWTTPSLDFFLGGVERISAIALHIGLSYIVYLAVKNKNAGFYFLAVILHAAVDAGMVVLSKVFLLSNYLMEIIMFVMVGIIVAAVIAAYKKEPKTETFKEIE